MGSCPRLTAARSGAAAYIAALHAIVSQTSANVQETAGFGKRLMPFWDRPKARKKGSAKPLTETQRQAAKARAEAAGRRYPNLVDNVWAARFVPSTVSLPARRDEDENE
jgi:hypothetical protein